MPKSQETWNKKEKEKKRQKKKKDKEQRKEERKANSTGGSFESMIAYVDEYGNISSTPPDITKKRRINPENIEVAVPRRKASEEVDVNRKGVVTFFNDSKGFGFIKDTESQESIFTHINGHIDQIKEGNKVTFRVEQGQKGLNAVEVKLLVEDKIA
jgi:cold shock CspA family protein